MTATFIRDLNDGLIHILKKINVINKWSLGIEIERPSLQPRCKVPPLNSFQEVYTGSLLPPFPNKHNGLQLINGSQLGQYPFKACS